MSIPRKVIAFREEKASELLRMADIIRRNIDQAIDVSAISKAVSQLRDMNYIPALKDGSRNPDNWGYTIEDFILPVSTDKHMKPDGITKVELRLNMKVIADSKQWMTFYDPLLELNFNVGIRGIKQGVSSSQYTGFHLDKHIDNSVSDEPHPIYHLQYCVNPYDLDDFDYGSVMHLDTPRIMHYPMDFILGIGFLTSNFFPTAFEVLTDDGAFTNLYRKYQEAIWKPYSHTLAQHWSFDRENIIWNPTSTLCPFLI